MPEALDRHLSRLQEVIVGVTHHAWGQAILFFNVRGLQRDLGIELLPCSPYRDIP